MPVLFDSSVYIAALRGKSDCVTIFRGWVERSSLWLSSVVLEELYAGAKASDRHEIGKLERVFDKVNRILIPNLKDWTVAGKILAQIGQRYGYEKIGRTRLTNDALISISAARTGTTVITTNSRDFALLAEFCALRWLVKTL